MISKKTKTPNFIRPPARPKRVKIGTYTIKIEYQDPPLDTGDLKENEYIYGYFSLAEGKIILDKSMENKFLKIILLHEILHAIHDLYLTDSDVYASGSDKIEKNIRILAPTLLEIFQNNIILQKFLLKKDL